ncbi:unnamed protein product [Ectocarpus sp. 12 AP-2014]
MHRKQRGWKSQRRLRPFFRDNGFDKTRASHKLNLDQQREHEARGMATATSTRAIHHTEKRRISITMCFLRGRISRGDLDYKKYATKLYNLAEKIITNFDGTPEDTQQLRRTSRAIDPCTDTDIIIDFARKEKDFSDRDCGDGKSAKTIKHLYWMFNTYVAESRRMYEDAVSRSHLFAPGEDKACTKKRDEFVKHELGEKFTYAPPKGTAVLPICSTGAVFIHIDMKTLKSWGLLNSNDAWWYKDVLRRPPTFFQRGKYQVSREQGERQVRVKRAWLPLESASKWSGQVPLDDWREFLD